MAAASLPGFLSSLSAPNLSILCGLKVDIIMQTFARAVFIYFISVDAGGRARRGEAAPLPSLAPVLSRPGEGLHVRVSLVLPGQLRSASFNLSSGCFQEGAGCFGVLEYCVFSTASSFKPAASSISSMRQDLSRGVSSYRVLSRMFISPCSSFPCGRQFLFVDVDLSVAPLPPPPR